MKKNKSMRIASGLLIATLLTTSIISGTFAKYTTKASGQNTARVAKWGVVVSVDKDFFGEQYKDLAGGNTITTSTDSDISVKTSTVGTNLIAPGTKNTEFNYGISGKPEVDGVISGFIESSNISLYSAKYYQMTEVEITSLEQYNEVKANSVDNEICVIRTKYSYDFYVKTDSITNQPGEKYFVKELITDLTKDHEGNPNSKSYYPIVFTMDGYDAVGSNNPVHVDTLAMITSEFNRIYADTGVAFNAGDDISLSAALPKISWEWAFCNHPTEDCEGYGIKTSGSGYNKTYSIVEACQYCMADTLLGNVMSAVMDGDADYLHSIASTGWNGYQSDFIGPGITTGEYYGVPFSTYTSFNVQFDMALTITQTD